MTRRLKAALLGLFVIAGLLVLTPAACKIREYRYLRDNKRVLEHLPTYPGSRVLYTTEGEYSHGEDPFRPPVGWSTLRSYRIRPGVSQRDVEAFYAREMTRRGWQDRRSECDSYLKDEAQVVVNAGGVNRRGRDSQLEIGVDAHGADEC